MKKDRSSIRRIVLQSFRCGLFIVGGLLSETMTAQNRAVVFDRDFSPAEGLVIPQEKPYRDEVCLNGFWDLQCVAVPSSWKSGSGIAPELSAPKPDQWEKVKIKIPSAINVNDWGRGSKVGEGTQRPYAPGSVYFPSYPEHWVHTRMGWLRRNFRIPADWEQKRILLHFEAVAGDCVIQVNGKEICRNFDAHLPFEADITAYVNREGENELLVGVRDTKLFDKSHPVYQKMGATYPTGSNTDYLLGIWQDVYMFAVPEIRITDVFVQPWVDKNELKVEVELINLSPEKASVTLDGEVREWVNQAGKDILTAPEIKWTLGSTALTLPVTTVTLQKGEKKKVVITQHPDHRLKFWTPDTPDLYTLLLTVNGKKQVYDCKATRFGWRQFKVVGDEFQLNGKKIQCFGDIQHPFSAYICSRRFAYAWYQMIKDFGGNAVRPHAQPWPRVYYELADEMGLMVLDETALFGSSIRLNLEEDVTWQRSHKHLERLIMRDRNHPSVIGWSAGNEMFAIALLNKPTKEVAAVWDDKLVELTGSARQFDPTRDFLTLDGDRDMDGRLPVWSKHFSHGLKLDDLPKGLNKPLIVGESGATKDVTGDGGHRHTNHLFWLHPGSQIVIGRSEQDDKYADAMKVTLNTRGDEGTGWSKAWKLNFWARLHDGNRSHKLLRSAMKLTVPGSHVGGVYTNLFDAHPPFQIDGNFGCTAGIAEMLMQSQGGYIELLPALPDAWKDGSFKGMKARGNFEVDAAWTDGKITAVEILSNSGAECVIKYPNAKDLKVSGAKVKVLADDQISFATVKGKRYTIK